MAVRGYNTIERYSSISRLWIALSGFYRRGLSISIPARTAPKFCRRIIRGVRFPQAGGLLDVARLRHKISEDDGLLIFQTEPNELGKQEGARQASEAMLALLEGNEQPMRALVSRDYLLEVEIHLGFTASRELIGKAEGYFKPIKESYLPKELVLEGTRWRSEMLRALIDRLASGALAIV